MVDLLKFRWPIDQAGYEIVLAEDIDYQDPERSPYPQRFIKGRGDTVREFTPMDYSQGIHRELAAVDGTEQSIIDFCNRFGVLHHQRPSSYSPAPRSASGGVILRFDMTLRLDHPYETMSVDWFEYHRRPVSDAIAAIDAHRPHEAIELFNRQLIDLTSQIDLSATKPGRSHKMHLIPRDLISAIWLMVEDEIAGGRTWIRCEQCSTWFVQKSKKRKHCSDRCKVRAYRERQKGASK